MKNKWLTLTRLTARLFLVNTVQATATADENVSSLLLLNRGPYFHEIRMCLCFKLIVAQYVLGRRTDRAPFQPDRQPRHGCD
jgi:hypothetical protein